MTGKLNPEELLTHIRAQRAVAKKIDAFLHSHWPSADNGDRNSEKAIALAQLFANFYTCQETLFMRVSQFFENSLSPRKWHKELLDKMALSVSNVRQQVIGEESRRLLFEFLQFRHFTRYYFDLEYDWERLDFLWKKYCVLIPLLNKDYDAFEEFLAGLSSGR